MALFTMAPAISAGLSSANANQIKNKNKLTMTAQNQAVSDKYKDDLGGYQLTGFNSPKPTSFYDTSGSSQTIELAGHGPTGPSVDDIKDYQTTLYNDVFDRDPVYNDDMSNTGDYWIGAIQRGDHGDRDWKQWLEDSVFNSREAKTSFTPKQKEYLAGLSNSGGGSSSSYSGPTMNDIKAMMEEVFSSYNAPWTPTGYGWGGTNANAVRINKSQASRFGTPYAGNKSSFNRSGSRLNSGTPWMNTLGM